MCRNDTTRRGFKALSRILPWAFTAAAGMAQQSPARGVALQPDWRRIGNSVVDLSLAAPGTGAVARVWFSADGTRLFLRTRSGKSFETKDFENWVEDPGGAPTEEEFPVNAGATLPEPKSKVVPAPGAGSRVYAVGRSVFRSDDGGQHWASLTGYQGESIIGSGLSDLAVSPRDPDDVVVANDSGVWRSLDGGQSWAGLNDELPNLPVRRLLEPPSGNQGMRILLDGIGAAEWPPGEKQAWRPVVDGKVREAEAGRQSAQAQLNAEITAFAPGEYAYAGGSDGRLWVSTDRGRSWRLSRSGGSGEVVSLYVDPGEDRLALAAVRGESGTRLVRTVNGGLQWDDFTGDLPPGFIHGMAADRNAGAVYVATDRGLYLTFADLFGGGPPGNWIRLSDSLNRGAVVDVRLDAAGNQVYVALEGHGVYAAPAPHRYRDPRVVNAADFSQRPAAPGSLLTVLGGRLMRAQAGYVDAPILHASDLESQIQVPFEVSGRSTVLRFEFQAGQSSFNVPLQEASPAVFVDRDGTPLLMDADSGVLLDAMNPARAGARVQILATGLGRVRPNWPTGMAAPLEKPPQVIAPARVYVDRIPVEVTRSTLAPGYVGFYLVEVQLPAIVNVGPAELSLEINGQQSNRVRIYLGP